MKGKHRTESDNADDKNQDTSLVLRPSCVPSTVLSTDFAHEKRQIVMSEAEDGVGCPKTLDKNMGLFAHRQRPDYLERCLSHYSCL